MSVPVGNKLRWGILSTATIAKSYYDTIVNSHHSVVIAVASRTKEKAVEFAANRNIEFIFDSYDALINSSHVDIIYIPLPTGVRIDYIIKSLEAGKHVLIEKPITVTAEDAERIFVLAKSKNLFVLDGTMWLHHERIRQIEEKIKNEVIGDVKYVNCITCSPITNGSNIRVQNHLEPFGCLGDLGWYSVRMILFLYKSLPIKVSGNYITKVNDTIHAFSGRLFFDSDNFAELFCSFSVSRLQRVTIVATNGQICLDNWITRNENSEYSVSVANQKTEIVTVDYFNHLDAMLSYFAAQVNLPDRNLDLFQGAVATMKVLCALIESANTNSIVNIN